MSDLSIDFDKSAGEKALFLTSAELGRIYEVPHDLIAMVFDIPNGECVVCMKEEAHGTPRFCVKSSLENIKKLLPPEEYIEFMADADDWNEENPDLAVHPYLVMKSAVQNYKLDNGQVVVVSVSDAWCISKVLGGVTQLDEKTKEFLEETFGTVPDQHGWVSGKNNRPPAERVVLERF